MNAKIPLPTAAPAEARRTDAIAPPQSPAPAALSAVRHPLAFALTLTGLAGFLDAAAYVHVGHLYVSFMSGNSTHLGIAVAERAVPDLLSVSGVIGAFVAGAAIGTAVADRAGPKLIRPVLGLEAALFTVAILAARAGLPLASVMIVALAMGIQNVLHQAVGGVDVGKGFVTGMLFSLGQSIARAGEGRPTLARALTSLSNWIAFVAGAALGALAIQALGFGLCLAAGLLLVAALFILAPARHP